MKNLLSITLISSFAFTQAASIVASAGLSEESYGVGVSHVLPLGEGSPVDLMATITANIAPSVDNSYLDRNTYKWVEKHQSVVFVDFATQMVLPVSDNSSILIGHVAQVANNDCFKGIHHGCRLGYQMEKDETAFTISAGRTDYRDNHDVFLNSLCVSISKEF